MKIVRMLMYEGSEDELNSHLAQAFIGPDRPFVKPRARHGLTIREIFRGSMVEDVVEHLDEGELLAKQEIDQDSITDLRLDEETAP